MSHLGLPVESRQCCLLRRKLLILAPGFKPAGIDETNPMRRPADVGHTISLRLFAQKELKDVKQENMVAPPNKPRRTRLARVKNPAAGETRDLSQEKLFDPRRPNRFFKEKLFENQGPNRNSDC